MKNEHKMLSVGVAVLVVLGIAYAYHTNSKKEGMSGNKRSLTREQEKSIIDHIIEFVQNLLKDLGLISSTPSRKPPARRRPARRSGAASMMAAGKGPLAGLMGKAGAGKGPLAGAGKAGGSMMAAGKGPLAGLAGAGARASGAGPAGAGAAGAGAAGAGPAGASVLPGLNLGGSPVGKEGFRGMRRRGSVRRRGSARARPWMPRGAVAPM